MKSRRLMCAIFGFMATFAPLSLHAQQQEEPLSDLSLEELMNVRVVTASNTAERLSDAPATVIVLTRDEIERRGYSDLSQILDDLPGMDVVRPYGDTYFKDYWRGYRNTIGDPFLIMIDGVVFNHLYFNTVDIMATFPLTNIDHVEVVYGPASSVYGANAFMGVINVITIDDSAAVGSVERVRLSAGSSDSRIADVSYFYKTGDMRLSLSGRVDNGVLDRSIGEQYEYTKNHYFADQRLWGDFANSSLGGSFYSPRKNRALDLRVRLGSIELAAQYFDLNAGYGTEYAGDRAQNNAVWSRPELSVYARQVRALNERVKSTTLARYRSSGVSNDSFFVESNPTAHGVGVDFSYWQSRNSSVSLFQDFDIRVNPRTSLTAGLKYEQKDLQKAYDVAYGPTVDPSDAVIPGYPFPDAPDSFAQQNRITTEDWGAYTQSWFEVARGQRLNLGVRFDRNSKYGSATNIRAGYVAALGAWTAKALFGEAFEEPNNRLLYGGWDGSGSDPTLRPERSRTIELSIGRTTAHLSNLLSVYDVRNRDTFVNTARGAENLSDRDVFGFDLHGQALMSVGAHELKAWAYYSRIARANEKKVDLSGVSYGTGAIGDLAGNKFLAGFTDVVAHRLTGTLRARYIGRRNTVESNPVGTIGGYLTADGLLRIDDVFVHGVSLSIVADNLLDRRYAHPGVRDANAGVIPGEFTDAGAWRGSGGFYSSLLPQPGRSITLNLHIDSTLRARH